MCWREKSLEVWVIRHCFHRRSLLLPKSEYCVGLSKNSGVWSEVFVYTAASVTLKTNLIHRYYANTETYLKAVALKRMPPNLQTVDMLKAGNISFVLSIFPAHTLYLYLSSLGCLMPEILVLACAGRWWHLL